MAEIARNHHEKLQDEDIEPDINIVEYNARLDEFLNEIPKNQCLEEPERSTMSWKIMEEQVSEALKHTKDGIATGLNSCPYELWKMLEK